MHYRADSSRGLLEPFLGASTGSRIPVASNASTGQHHHLRAVGTVAALESSRKGRNPSNPQTRPVEGLSVQPHTWRGLHPHSIWKRGTLTEAVLLRDLLVIPKSVPSFQCFSSVYQRLPTDTPRKRSCAKEKEGVKGGELLDRRRTRKGVHRSP